MAQTAYNDRFPIPADTWTLISEIDCTMVVEGGQVEVIGAASQPAATVQGISYANGQGFDAATGTLARFAGDTAAGIYVMSRGKTSTVFLSRAAN